jgi:hypothetical protein
LTRHDRSTRTPVFRPAVTLRAAPDAKTATLYRDLASSNPARFEETYRQHLAALQRAYHQAGLTDAAVRLHLPKESDETSTD